ncbi:autotransporter domain-containing protein [Acidithiobacillus sp.]|uniref:autotransporter outer membrane beta-barrel domain-containing protein n=1 Tax=Acidithiobacillus sp. TaxID=1872118 RepID=UPI002312BD51|nr:autotransporter domain-containing protein [Acidithiobacillus sp.]MDA8246936.1 autotransporter domain-containing protein [Acidithiobacillus sp.]
MPSNNNYLSGGTPDRPVTFNLAHAVRLIVRSQLMFPLLCFPCAATATPQLISGGGTVMAGAGNTSNAGIVVNASTLDIAAGSGLGSGLFDLQNGALRTSGSMTIDNNIALDQGVPPAALTSLCGGAYCFGVGDSMTLNTVGNTYVSTPSLLQQMQFPSDNKALGIWLTKGWQANWMAGMQKSMQQGSVPILFDYYLGDLGSMGSGAWGYVQQNAQAWLANTQLLANYLSTLSGTVSVVIQPEFNVPGVGNQAQFGAWLAQAAQILQHAQHPGLTILTSAGVGDFGVYSGSTENASQWSNFYPSLSVAAPYLNFITFQEMRGAVTGGAVVSPQQEGMSTIAGRVIAFSRYLQATYGKPLLLGYMMMNPYTPAGDTANWSAIAAKAYAEILQVSPELQQQGVFGSLAMALFNDMNHATINGVDYFGTSSDYFGLVNSNGAPNTAEIGNGPYVLNANGQAWVNGTANASTVQEIRNGGTIDTAGNADTFNGTFSGNGGLFVVGGGSVTLTGNNTYAGNTYIEDSTLLQLGNGGSTGRILGNILNDGVLSFHRSGNVTFPGQISGLGIVWQQGPGTLYLTGSNSYTAGTLVTGGTLGVGAESALGSGNITLDGGTFETTSALQDSKAFFIGLNGGTLNTDGYTDTFAGNFIPMNNTIDGGVTVTGGGTALFTGEDSYTGGTTITPGTTLQIGNGDNSQSGILGNVLDNGSIVFDVPEQVSFPGMINGSGSVREEGSGILALTGNNGYAGGTVVSNGGTLAIGAESEMGSGNITLNNGTFLTTAALQDGRAFFIGQNGGTINNAGFINRFAGNFIPANGTSTGGLTISGGGTTILSGENTYSGGTTINGYTSLQIGSGGMGGNLPGNVVDNGALAFNSAGNIVVPGTISGYGMLWQQGPGLLTLTGDNTYQSGTMIAGGTLDVANVDALGGGVLTLNGGTFLTARGLNLSLPVVVNSNGGVVDTGGNIDTVNSRLSGSGPLTIVGGGSLILDNASNTLGHATVGGVSGFPTATTPTTLEVGDATHPGATLNSAVTVTSGGVLRGHGTVVGNVTNDGTVFPGGSIGTLHINGNYTQNADGTLAIEVAPLAHDVLAVSGTADLAGKLLIQVDPGASYVAGDQYQILTAGGGIRGAFSTTVYDPFPAYVTPNLATNENGLSIRLVATPGQAGMNDAPAYLGGQIYADIPTVLINMTMQADALVFAHDKGSAGAVIAHTMLDSMGTVMSGQLANLSVPGAQDQNTQNGRSPSGFWLQGLGDVGNATGSAGISAFSDQSGGVYGGADFRHHGFTAGVAMGYVHTLLNLPATGYTDGSQANIGSVSAMLYGKYRYHQVVMNVLVGYSSESIQGLRNLPNTGATALGSYHGQMIHAVLQGGYAVQTPWVTVTPNAGVASYSQSQPGFSEHGATSLLDLNYAAQTDNETDATAGVDFSRVYHIGKMTVTPHVDLGVQRILTGNTRAITEALGQLAPVSEVGIAPDRTSLATDVGVDLHIIHRLSLYAEYLGNYAGNISTTGLAMGGVWRW